MKLYMLMNYCASLAIVFMNKWAYNHVRTALATVQSHYIIHPPVRLPSFPRGWLPTILAFPGGERGGGRRDGNESEVLFWVAACFRWRSPSFRVSRCRDPYLATNSCPCNYGVIASISLRCYCCRDSRALH